MDKWIALVKAKMAELELSQEKVAERVGRTQGGVGHYLRRARTPDIPMMNKILAAVDLGHLEVRLQVREKPPAYGEASPEAIAEDELLAAALTRKLSFRYPIIDWERAGRVGEESKDASKPSRYEATDYRAKGDAFWLRVSGDAMTAPLGLSIPEGMMILVDPDIEISPGSMLVARWPGGTEATFRQLIEEGGQRYLKPLNPTYPKALLTDECLIIGGVVQATIKFV